jgi:hypothetical protein
VEGVEWLHVVAVRDLRRQCYSWAMIDNKIRLATHLPTIAIIPFGQDEREDFGKLVWPIDANGVEKA